MLIALSSGKIDLGSEGDAQLLEKMKSKILREVIRVFYKLIAFSDHPDFLDKLIKDQRLALLLLSLISMDKMMISKLINIVKVFNYVETDLFKAILKLAQPTGLVPPLEPFFLAFEKFSKHKYPKGGDEGKIQFKMTIKFDYDLKFVAPEVFNKLKFEDIDDGDLLCQLSSNKMSPEASALGVKLLPDGIEIDAP